MKNKKLRLFGVLLFVIVNVVVFVFPKIRPFLLSVESGETLLTDNPETTSRPSLTLNGYQIFLEIADTDETRRQGLSNHSPLAENEGMLFVFDQPGNYGFWMKDMLFPLDFIYLNGNTVVDLVENVPAPRPGETPATVRARAPFDKALEVNAGLIAKIGVQVGDKVNFAWFHTGSVTP